MSVPISPPKKNEWAILVATATGFVALGRSWRLCGQKAYVGRVHAQPDGAALCASQRLGSAA